MSPKEVVVIVDGAILSAILQVLTRYSANDPQFPVNDWSLFTGKSHAVCPGVIDTDMVRTTVTRAAVDAYALGFPLGRLGTPSEVADLVVFLASPLSSYITGASIDINGGNLTI